MKITSSKILKWISTSIALFIIFSCSKDSDLLADYVVGDAESAQLFYGRVQDDIFFSTNESSVILDVLANDGFINSKKVNIIDVTQPTKGSVVINADKTLTYTPTDTIESDVNQDDRTNEEEDVKNELSTTTPPGTVELPASDNTKEEEEEKNEFDSPKQPSQKEEQVDDNFDYKVEITEDDGSVTEQEATVVITKKARDYGVLKAFPTAYGAGAESTGGRGGEVYIVSSLKNSGPGSFRDAVSKSNRYIIFNVSGTIVLTSNLSTSSNNLTIAGQTAPEGGITITKKLLLFNNCNNIIMRHIRFKPEYIPEYISPGNNKNTGYDALNINNITNSIFDHVSVAWGGDEAVSIVGKSNRVTYQYGLIMDSHKGMILGDSRGDPNILSDNMTLYKTAFINSGYRFPNVEALRSESINNVVHNWDSRLNIVSHRDNIRFNEINNYYPTRTEIYPGARS